MRPTKHSHCSYCGTAYADEAPWPRACGGCAQVSYLNPLPVAVALVPVGAGLLCVRRAIEPGHGKLALPGGFIDLGETWQQAAAREIREEAGLVIDPDTVEIFRAYSAAEAGVVLLFGRVRGGCEEKELAAFTPNDEVSELQVITAPTELAFPLHTRAVEEFFAGR